MSATTVGTAWGATAEVAQLGAGVALYLDGVDETSGAEARGLFTLTAATAAAMAAAARGQASSPEEAVEVMRRTLHPLSGVRAVTGGGCARFAAVDGAVLDVGPHPTVVGAVRWAFAPWPEAPAEAWRTVLVDEIYARTVAEELEAVAARVAASR